MGALYSVNYGGQAGNEHATIYVGKNLIVGNDVGKTRYQGTYTETGGRLIGVIIMTTPPGGISLVTGETVRDGKRLRLHFDWPNDFADGQAQALTVDGQAVHVTLDKVGDIP